MARKDITNMHDLTRYFEKDLVHFLNKIADEALKQLKSYIRASVYLKYSEGDYYTRTYEVLESVIRTKVKQRGNEYYVELYLDDKKIYPHSALPGSGEFNAHMSLDGAGSYNGKGINEWIIEWLNEGYDNKFLSGEKHAYYEKGLHFVEETISWIESEIDMFFKKELEKAGWKIQVGRG